MRYEIRFDEEVSLASLRRALLTRFGVEPESVQVGPWDADGGRRPPAAMLLPPEGGASGFAWVLVGDADLERACGLGERELAVSLAVDLGRRALVDDGTSQPDRWILIARDSSLGAVIVDEDAADEGDLRVLHAEEPIAGEPGLTVVPAPRW